MRWKIVHTEGKYHVRTLTAEGHEGESVSVHESRDEAAEKLRALYEEANEPLKQLGESATIQPSKEGSKWEVTVIRAGTSLRSPFFRYLKDVLIAALPVFNGAKVYALIESDDFGHKRDRSKKAIREAVGILENPRMDGDEMKADFTVLPSEEWLKKNLSFLESRNKLDFYQLSIDGSGRVQPAEENGRTVMDVMSIEYADVDIVQRGAAGGKFNRMVESSDIDNTSKGAITMNVKQKLQMLFSLLYPTFLESKNVDWAKVNENELYTYLREADKPQDRLHLPDGFTESVIDQKLQEIRTSITNPEKAGGGEKKGSEADLKAALDPMQKQLEKFQKQACLGLLSTKLTESQLPQPLKDKIKAQFKDMVFEESQLDDAIKVEREAYGKIMQEYPNNRGLDVQITMDGMDKFQLALDGFFLTSSQALKPLREGTDEAKHELKGVSPFRSIKEAYITLTGDEDISGIAKRGRRLLEAVDTTAFAKSVADALNKRLVRDYGALNLDTWRTFTDIVPLKDFKTQHRVRFGGYANLPTVNQGQAYVPLTSPTDEESTYSPAKKGGTEEITREAIMNDDVGSIQRIPTRMARAAGQTLHEFVFDFINPAVNPTIYDSVALYHSGSHANTGTTALDATSLAAARLRMKKQTQAGSSKRLGIRARYLVAPSDLEKIAYELLTAAFNKSNATPEFLQQIGVTPIIVDYWTDANDWALIADRADVVGMEIGFVNGQETPELFVSDLTNVGSWFTNDKITYKIRHEYGGAIIDYRAFEGSVVA